ncbi:DUF4357 domain-containing protein [Selenomonas sp. KH1T6]|uniref:DUF4357 domain-containing protein n=1 Tax=Selenomonas sp. KH1T6 TaxID=3158784 RepID=UPI0008A7882C|nr:protein of unknown function [Selenomonas ruminantium]
MNLPFNGYEQAKFTEVYMGLRDKPYVAWYKDIGELSGILRKYALMRGLEIDDTFRNSAGLMMQARCMQYIDTDGLRGMSNGAQWMKEMLGWYKSDIAGFKNFLAEANIRMGITKAEPKELPEEEMPELQNSVKSTKRTDVPENLHEAAPEEDYALDKYETALLVELCSRSYKNQEMKELSQHMQKYVASRHIMDREGLRTVYALNKRTSFIYRLLSENGEKSGTLPLERKMTLMYLKSPWGFEKLLEEARERLKLEKKPVAESNPAPQVMAPSVESAKEPEYEYTPEQHVEKVGETKQGSLTEPQLRCQKMLEDFPNGVSLSSPLEMDRFVLRYEQLYGTAPTNLLEILSTVGRKRGDRVFPAVSGEARELLQEIRAEIKKVFEQGYSCVYLESVLDKYRVELNREKVYTVEELCELLEISASQEWEISGQRLVRRGRRANLKEDVLRYLKERGGPTSLDTMEHDMWQVPITTLRQQGINTNDAIINTDTRIFMAAESFPLGQGEIEKIAAILKEELPASPAGKLKDEECRKIIWEKLPGVKADTRNFTIKAFHGALRYWLSGPGRDFVIEGRYIAFSNQRIQTGTETLKQFCLNRDRFTVEELQSFAKENNITLASYQDVVRENSLRLNKEEFCGLGQVKFDVAAVDSVLELYCPEDYAPLSTVKNFMHLPMPEGIYWSDFLLESYVNCISRKFMLLHARFSESEIAGAMVRRESGLTDYDEVLADVLAKSEVWSTPEEALEYLVAEGYLVRNRYGKINEAIRQAKKIRENPEAVAKAKERSPENKQHPQARAEMHRHELPLITALEGDEEKMQFYCNRGGANAIGCVTEHGFTVKKGSSVSAESMPSNKTYNHLREALMRKGIIDGGIFQEDYEFASPSAAGAVASGYSSDGNVDWKSADGRPFKDFGIRVQRGEVFYEHQPKKKHN